MEYGNVNYPIDKSRGLPQALAKEEIRRLFRAMEGEQYRPPQQGPLPPPVRLCSAHREGEQLRVEDVDLEAGTLRVIGKGDKERCLYLKPMTVMLLKEYIQESELTGFLFPSRQAGHIGVGTMDCQSQKHVERAGLKKKVTPHTLRHSVAVHYLMGGAPISFVQDLLGHENLATTGIHTQLADEMMNEVTLSVPTAIEAIKEGKVVGREARYAVRWAQEDVGVWRVVT